MEEKYLIFTADGRKFSLGFSDVKIIVPSRQVTAIPDFPDYVPGTIINDGINIPVINLRKRFGYKDKDFSDRDCIIITTGEKSVGLLCDSIDGFAEVHEDKLQEPPSLNSEASARFLKGQFITEENIPCYLIDPEKVIRLEDEAKLESAVGENAD